MDGTATFAKKFYNELINRLFNSESYFYHCLNQQLNKSKTQNVLSKDGKIYLIERLINKLVHSSNAIAELDKLSKLPGFGSLCQQIKRYIMNFDFKNSDHDKIKNIISSVSNFFIKRIVLILQNYDARNNLADYLSEQTFDLQNKIVDFVKPTVRLYPDEHLPKIGHSENSTNVLFGFFKEEVLKSLKPLQQYNKPNSSSLIDNKFRSDWQKCSLRIKYIAMMHGHEQIEAIVIRIIRVLDFQKKSNKITAERLQILLLSARDFIERYLFEDQTQQSFLALLNNFDDYLLPIQYIDKQAESDNSSEAQFDQPEQKAEIIVSQLKDTDVAKHTDEKDFRLPGEDDPELLSLIKEISDSQQAAQTKKNDAKNEYSMIQNITKESSDPDTILEIKGECGGTQEKDADKSDLQFFSEEIFLYIKLIRSISKSLLKNYADDSTLEDLDLAASSLKSYAMKFGYAISQLPDVIEDIAQLYKSQKIELPIKTMQMMADAIILLQNISHDVTIQVKFRIIFKGLNQYLYRIKSCRKNHELFHL